MKVIQSENQTSSTLNVVTTGLGLVSVAVGIGAGIGMGQLMNTVLPAATTVPEKIIRHLTIAGVGTATQYLVSEAMNANVAEIQSQTEQAIALQQAKLALKQAKQQQRIG